MVLHYLEFQPNTTEGIPVHVCVLVEQCSQSDLTRIGECSLALVKATHSYTAKSWYEHAAEGEHDDHVPHV
jgi:hypothetical protein